MNNALLFLLLVSSIALSGALALYAWFHRTRPGAALLAFMLLSALLAEFAYLMELVTPGLEGKMLWVRLRYLGVLVFVPMSLWLVLWYTGHANRLTRKWLALIWFAPALSLLFFYTNDLHHWHYVTVTLDTGGAFPVIAKTTGPAYLFYMLIFFGYLLVSVALLTRHAHVTPGQRAQSVLLIVAFLVPMMGYLLYLALPRVFHLYNPGVALFAFSGLALAWAIFRFNLLDLMPAAYSFVFEQIQMGVIVLDRAGNLVDLNDSALRDLELQRAAIIGKPFIELAVTWQALLARFQDQAAPDDTEFSKTDADSARTFTLQISPLQDQRKRNIGQVLLLRDITERKALEQQTLAQEKNLAAAREREKLARELHDGVGQVMGYVNAQAQAADLYLNNGQTAMAQATLANLAQVAQDAHADIRDFILGVKTGETHRAGMLPTLKEYIAHFGETYGLPVELSQPPELPDNLLDANAQTNLFHIVQEALTNARKHAHAQHARVVLTILPQDVQVLIQDDGIGFDFCAAPGQSDGHFGLEILRERVNECGGTLEIRSARGQGTVVIATLPRLPEPNARLADLRVLIADDQPLFRDGLRNLLAARGITVVDTAANGLEAIQMARALHPDIILMDVNMPELDGLGALERIRAEMPAIRVILLTIASDRETLLRAIRGGASGYLLKDLDAGEFFHMLERAARGESLFDPQLTARVLRDMAAQDTNAPASGDEGLSARQKQILTLVADGWTYKEIAHELALSEATVKYHMSQIFDEFGVSNRDQAVAVARAHGWI